MVRNITGVVLGRVHDVPNTIGGASKTLEDLTKVWSGLKRFQETKKKKKENSQHSDITLLVYVNIFQNLKKEPEAVGCMAMTHNFKLMTYCIAPNFRGPKIL